MRPPERPLPRTRQARYYEFYGPSRRRHTEACATLGGIMPETSPAQGTLKRLIEAEDQAREILKAAEKHEEETLGKLAKKPDNLSRLFVRSRPICCGPG